MQTKIIERYFFFGLLLATFVFTFFIFRPFWIVLILGASFSIVLYPIYEWLLKKKFPAWLSSFLTVLFLIIILCGPLLGIGAIVFNQSQNVYHQVVINENAGPFTNLINEKINNILPEGISFNVMEKASDFVSFVSGNVTKIFSSTLSAIFSFLLMLLTIFHFLKDGERWKKALIKLSPLKDSDDQKIITRLSQTINGVIKGYLLIALIQGVLMGLGLAIFNVPNPALWGVVAGIASLIPSVGTAIVSIPAIIFLYATGHTTETIGLLIYSILMVGSIDNLLNPILIGKKIKIPSLLILFSVLGGISLLGPVGLLIGPLIVSLLYTLISIYRNEFQQGVIL
ncbi:MAG: AI-2E family transporter [Candidatus Paceibacterota bacterium]|jgi:predicted PurR-regulated permease PerM